MLNFSYDSINAKFYRWCWSVKEMPNLCEYFWKTIIMWILSPMLIICLPDILVSIIKKKKINNINSSLIDGFKYHFLIQLIICISISTYSYFTYGSNTFFVGRDHSIYTYYKLFGFVFTSLFFIGIISIFLIYLIDRISKFFSTRKIDINIKRNILVEGVKSWYNKSCPKINWIKKEN